MKLNEILFGSGGFLVVILTLIEITPIKFNPISWILKWIGSKTQHEVMKKVDIIQEDINGIKIDLNNLQEEDNRKEAESCRYRILRFADECYLGQQHSHEHYKQILQDVTMYECYCDKHPEFPNQVAVAAIAQIKKCYTEHLDKRDFLA